MSSVQKKDKSQDEQNLHIKENILISDFHANIVKKVPDF